MPEIRYYTVEQTRTLKVMAASPGDAADIAREVFKTEEEINKDLNKDPRVHKPIRIISLDIREDLY
jgi:hypothetical protein